MRHLYDFLLNACNGTCSCACVYMYTHTNVQQCWYCLCVCNRQSWSIIRGVINSSTPSSRAGSQQQLSLSEGCHGSCSPAIYSARPLFSIPAIFPSTFFVLTWEKRHLIFFLVHPWGLTNTQTEKLWPDLLSHAIIVNNIWSPKTRLNCFVAVSASVSHTWLLKWQHTVINPSLSLQWEKPDIIVHSWLIMTFLSLYINSCHARWNAGSLCYFLWNIKNNHLWIICNLAALKYSIYYNYYIYYNISVMLSLQQVCNYITPSLMQKIKK